MSEDAKAAEVNATLDEDPLAEGGGAKKSNKKLILIAVPVLLLLGVGAGLFFSGALDKIFKKDGAAAEASAEEHGAETAAKGEHGKEGEGGEGVGTVFLKIPDLTVNLSSEDDGQSRFLRLSVQLELKSQADLQAVEKVMPRVVDQFQTYLRELRVKDLKGSSGIYRLQMELLARVNQAAYPVEVQDVLFQEILIQ